MDNRRTKMFHKAVSFVGKKLKIDFVLVDDCAITIGHNKYTNGRERLIKLTKDFLSAID